MSSTTDANPLASPPSTTNYLVFVVDNWGCAGTDNVTVAVNPAADDGQSSKSRNGFDARLFPNPATELIYVNFEGIEELENVRFEVLDMPGRRIIESILPAAENNQLQINVSGWQPGQYFAQIVIGNEVVTKKFMVMK